jgi:hypothetical protein
MNTSSANLEMSARVAFGEQWKELNDFLLVNTSKLDNGTER